MWIRPRDAILRGLSRHLRLESLKYFFKLNGFNFFLRSLLWLCVGRVVQGFKLRVLGNEN